MHSRCARAALSIVGALLIGMTIAPRPRAQGASAELTKALKQAKFAIVGTITETRASRRRSSWGDDIIVTTAIVHTDETLRGAAPSWTPLELEGGTLNGVTMEASETPLTTRGERAVFLVDQLPDGRFVAHGRRAGILKLRADDRVEDSALTLSDVRRLAQEGH
jgi:hypothetical protein